jgi:hypothetical protein
MVDTKLEEHLLICEFNDGGAKADDVDDDDNGTDDDDYEIISMSDEDDVVNDKEDDCGGLFEWPEPDGEVVTCSKKGCKWQCFVINDFATNKDAVLAKHNTDKHCCDGGDVRSAAPEPKNVASRCSTFKHIVCRAKRCGWSRYVSTVIATDELDTHEKSCRRYVQEKAAAQSYAACRPYVQEKAAPALSYAAACSAQPQDPSSRLPRAACAASCACRHTASGCVAHLQYPPPQAAEDGGPRKKKARQLPSSPDDLHELSAAAIAILGEEESNRLLLEEPFLAKRERKRDRLNKLLARAAQKSLKEERKRRTNVSKEVIVLLL